MMKNSRLAGRSGKNLYQCLGILSVLAISACGGGGGSNNFDFGAESALSGCADTDSCASNPDLEVGGERPAQVLIPSNYNTSTRYPLIILLHGFGANGILQAIYMGLDQRIDPQQYILVMPDGTENAGGARFWNATPACCAFTEEEKQIDDVAYIRGLIQEAADTYSIDVSRIGLIGHSNGGFMALRMACEASDIVTSVVSLAGSTFADDASCAPASSPVSVLTMHGDADATISYTGSQIANNGYPGAPETTQRFAAHAGCDTNNPVMAPNLDVVASIAGAETTVLEYTNCNQSTAVTLWTLVGGAHIPSPWVDSALDAMVDWNISHPR